jgi:hypothetical protein
MTEAAAGYPTGPVSEVKCANNIGIKVFGANPFVSRETSFSADLSLYVAW